eukprot:1060038_1
MSTASHFAFQAKSYNEAFAFKSSLWKLQKWLNQFRSHCKSASPSPASTISRSSGTTTRHKRKQETENNFRSIMEELQTMLTSHKRKHKITRVRKKPTKSYALSRALKNIGENLGLSVDDEVEEDQTLTKITLGSMHSLSQFLIQIAFNTQTCDVVLDECCFEVTLCQREDHEVDITFDGNANKSMMNDLKDLIDNGDFDKLHTKLLLNKFFDDFYNYFPSLLLNDLKEEDNGAGTIHKQIELCLRQLPNTIRYERQIQGPSVIFAEQIMDCILLRIKPPLPWRLSFVGLYPLKCMANPMQINPNSTVTINPIVCNGNDVNESGGMMHEDKDKQPLLYWFVLNPAIIVPLEVAKKVFTLCVGPNAFEWHKTKTEDMEEVEKRSTHSSWIDQTYSFHHMLIGETELKYRKPIEIFENDYQYFQCKNTECNSNGVRIDQIPIYDLKYVNDDSIHESVLYKVIDELKNWVIINQLYAQCFHHNRKKWKIKTEGYIHQNKLENVYHRFEIQIRNSNHLEVTHIVNNSVHDDESKANSSSNCSMDIDNDDLDEYNKYQKEYKLPPKLDEWSADFAIDENHTIHVSVQYLMLDTKTDELVPIDVMYDRKVNEILTKTNSLPITLSYISKLFDGRYLKEKLKCKRRKQQEQEQLQKQSTMDDDTDNMIDID